MDKLWIQSFATIEDASFFYENTIISDLLILPRDLWYLVFNYILPCAKRCGITKLIKNALTKLDDIDDNTRKIRKMHAIMEFISFYMSVFSGHPRFMQTFQNKIEHFRQHDRFSEALEKEKKLCKYREASERYHKFIHMQNFRLHLPFHEG